MDWKKKGCSFISGEIVYASKLSPVELSEKSFIVDSMLVIDAPFPMKGSVNVCMVYVDPAYSAPDSKLRLCANVDVDVFTNCVIRRLDPGMNPEKMWKGLRASQERKCDVCEAVAFLGPHDKDICGSCYNIGLRSNHDGNTLIVDRTVFLTSMQDSHAQGTVGRVHSAHLMKS